MASDESYNPIDEKLYWAANIGKLSDVQSAVSEGANINTRNVGINKWTPLMAACYEGYIHVVEYLLSVGADPNITDGIGGDTALHKAAYNKRSIECIELLLDKGADPSIANRFGKTPLDVAKEKNDKQIISLLKKKS